MIYQVMQQKQLIKLREEYQRISDQHPDNWETIRGPNVWETIQSLNQTVYQIDHILLRAAYDAYPDQPQSSRGSYEMVQSFFRHVLDQLPTIEQKYLGGSEDQMRDGYERNKHRVSMFIRDQNEHYQETLKQYSEKTNEKGRSIKADQIYEFMSSLFRNEHIEVLLGGHPYFEGTSSIEQAVGNYWILEKGVPPHQLELNSLWLPETEILDFLFFWFSEMHDQQFHILYARTQSTLKAHVADLKAQASLPDRLKTETVHEQSYQEQLISQSPDQAQTGNTLERIQLTKIEGKLSTLSKHQHNLSPLSKPDNNLSPLSKPPHRRTKKEQLQLKIPELFFFGCKRRYPLPKGITFEAIGSQSKIMDLEKFMNFCNYFDIPSVMAREVLQEMFKTHALNRLTLDQHRFSSLILSMVQAQPKVTKKMLEVKSPQQQLREKNRPTLSTYKFKLRPINGRSIETLQESLQSTKQQKQRHRQDILSKYLQKRSEGDRAKLKYRKRESTLISSQQTSLYNIENMRDESFDPEKFLDEDPDELLNAYESNRELGALQSLLSTRLKKGEQVLKKINTDKQLKLYS